MKTLQRLAFFSCLLAASSQAAINQVATTPEQPADITRGIAAVPVSKGSDNQVWERVSVRTNKAGRITAHTNSYVQVESGMHYKEDGEWKPTKEEINIVQDGAMASKGPHKVGFAVNTGAPWTIDLVTPDAKRLKSRVVGLAFYDYKTEESVLIAELKESGGQLVGDHRIVYPDAFTEVKADISYTYTKSGLEQDVILRERPPLPEEFGLNPDSTRLEVWTEFFDAPQPIRYQQTRKRWLKSKEDQILDFGSMVIGYGTAFGISGEQKPHGILVEKEWVVQDGRSFLVEEVSFRWITPHLIALPKSAQAGIKKVSPDGVLFAVAKNRLFREAKVAKTSFTNQIEVASRTFTDPGFVLDYSLVNTTTNFTFQSDSTYYISGTVNLSGTNVIEGGTVIKFNTNSDLNILGSIRCDTDAYMPAFLTAKDDNSAGDVISGSTGIPTNTYANVALSLQNGGDVQYLRICYATKAIYSPQNYSVKHSQFVHCGWGLVTENAVFDAQNILMYDVGTNFFGRFYHGTAQHLTSHLTASLTDDSEFGWYSIESCDYSLPSSYVWLTNSLISEVASEGIVPVYKDHTQTASEGAAAFQTVGAGAHYLAENSPYRNAGTISLDTSLSAALKKKTTYPPVVITSDAAFTDSYVLVPQAQRDTDTPDLGYHYDPMDYALGKVFLQNATLTIPAGTALGTFAPNSSWNYGVALMSGSQFLCEGTPNNRNWIARYNMIQEGATTNWNTIGDSMIGNYLGGTTPTARFRFTDWSCPAQDSCHFKVYSSDVLTSFNDCQFHEGKIDNTYEGPVSFNMTNCLFERAYIEIDASGSPNEAFRNNLFWKGTLKVYSDADLGVWTMRENLFDKTTILQGGLTFDHDYNGYTTGSDRLTNNAAHDVVTNLIYETSWLGKYYQPTNSGFINVGGRNADVASLYHYTVLTNQVKETNSVVDIGYHYVAVDSNGAPIDSDGEGLADYFEDQNGDGTYNTGDIADYHYADTDGDGVNDYLEYIQGRNPRINGSVDDTDGVIKLRVYTPLK